MLKVEYNTSVAQLSVPIDTAVSRILYMSETVNGTAVPTSGYILWPYLPRKQPDGRYQVVAFAHGTTDAFAECAPSHARPFQYQYGVAYTLALQGYVVVATDFQGLGVNETADGAPIIHPYLWATAAANDVVHSVAAAQAAFPELSCDFVVIGHSEGGAAAWGAAQRQAQKPIAGYLGTVAGSPSTNLTLLSGNGGSSSSTSASGSAQVATLRVAHGMKAVYPSFEYSDWLTTLGLARLNLADNVGGCGATNAVLFATNGTLALPSYVNTTYYKDWVRMGSTGGKAIGGPMLVLQGEADPTVPYKITDLAVKETCVLYPQSQIEYLLFADVTHNPSMWVSQRQWLKWIEDRFANKTVVTGCSGNSVNHTSAMPLANYLQNANFYIAYANQPEYMTIDA